MSFNVRQIIILNQGRFRARRQSAEQGSLGSQSRTSFWRKGVTVMVKNVFNGKTLLFPVALVLVGWLTFICGVYVIRPIWLKLVLLSTARVLP